MDYLTVKEVAELKNCSERYIKRLAKNGKIKAEVKFDPEIKQERLFYSGIRAFRGFASQIL